MSDIKLPVRNNPTVDGKKRLRRLVPVAAITAAAVGFALVGGTAGPTNATAQQSSAASRYVTVSGGHFAFDSAAAEKAGVGSKAVSAESSLVAGLNKALAHSAGSTTSDAVASAVKSHAALTDDQAAVSDSTSTTITIVSGFTITVSSSGIVVYISKGDVTEIQNVAGFVKDITGYLGSAAVASAIAAALVAAVPGLGTAAAVTAAVTAALAFVGFAISLSSDVLKICTAADGSATFTLPLTSGFPYVGIPTCSAQ